MLLKVQLNILQVLKLLLFLLLELIYFQNKLIKLLMVKIDLLTEKCDVLASTLLSEDLKKIQISGRIVPFNNNFTSKNWWTIIFHWKYLKYNKYSEKYRKILR